MFNLTIKKKMNQITNHILMIRPVNFQYNCETAVNNYYQNNNGEVASEEIQKDALNEFNSLVDLLQDKKVNIILAEDTENSNTPDSIFPNNWITTHSNGIIFLYPMFAKNRRMERRYDIIKNLKGSFYVKEIVDNTEEEEKKKQFLEGTGSMVLDRVNKIAYASISERTHKKLFYKWCKKMSFLPVTFVASQSFNNQDCPIYHTNVMMSITNKFAIICLDAIKNTTERNRVISYLEDSNKEIINITEEQKSCFCGNVLQVIGDQEYLVMSDSAYYNFSNEQLDNIKKHCSVLHSPLDTIERFGGGSVRCMMAEIFLPKI